MTTLQRRRKPKRKLPRKALRRLVEFKGIRSLSFREYRDDIRDFYDGPRGAVLALGSLISLHEPLIGHVLRARKFDITGSRKILDVGSGTGQILGHLLKQALPDTQLVAFDLSHQMLRRARTRVKDRRPQYIAGDMMRMPFADSTFDCVTCGWVIEHLPDPRPGLREIGRVLRPGARALILATEDTVSGAFVSRTWRCRTYNRSELERSVRRSGPPLEGSALVYSGPSVLQDGRDSRRGHQAQRQLSAARAVFACARPTNDG